MQDIPIKIPVCTGAAVMAAGLGDDRRIYGWPADRGAARSISGPDYAYVDLQLGLTLQMTHSENIGGDKG